MALVTINDLDVLEAKIDMPRTGTWAADIRVAAASGISSGDSVTISVNEDAATFVGSVVVAVPYLDDLRLRVAGGGGTLRDTVSAKEYERATVKIIATDILGSSESISSTANAATLAQVPRRWNTTERTRGSALTTLVDNVSAIWRVLPDGSIYIGPETWAASAVTDWEELKRDDSALWVWIATDSEIVLPGTTLGGERVDNATHHISDRRVRSELWLAE